MPHLGLTVVKFFVIVSLPLVWEDPWFKTSGKPKNKQVQKCFTYVSQTGLGFFSDPS